jgi:hypothetical protein
MIFSTLEDLPDVPLTLDLTPRIMAGVQKAKQSPALWRQPAFIAQSLLTIILLVSFMPMLRTLGQQIASWDRIVVLPTMQFPSISEVIAQLLPLLTWDPRFSFPIPELSFSIPIRLKYSIILLMED